MTALPLCCISCLQEKFKNFKGKYMQGLIISSLSQLYSLKEKVFWILFLRATTTLLPPEICASNESSDNGNTNGCTYENTLYTQNRMQYRGTFITCLTEQPHKTLKHQQTKYQSMKNIQDRLLLLTLKV